MKPGDPVGELADPMAQSNEAAALAAANKASGSGSGGKVERGSGLGIYRTGGPTTLFGGSGWGPFSDGPLNVGRKALLNRENANEENWMFVIAERTIEQNQEWAKARKKAARAIRGVPDQLTASLDAISAKSIGESPKRSNAMEVDVTGEGEQSTHKRKKSDERIPLGIYEAHSGLVHCKDTCSRCAILCSSVFP